MTKNLGNLLNGQIQKEFESAYIYLGISSYFNSIGLFGFSHWYRIQAQEEEKHAMKIYDYLHEANQLIEFYQINKPEGKVESIEQALNTSLRHEEYVTKLIENIYDQAEKDMDYFTMDFLDWFIAEQFEEEHEARKMIQQFELFGNSSEGLYHIDHELSKRKL